MLDKTAVKKAEERQAKLAKPPGSLGRLEEISVRLAGITGQISTVIKDPCVVIMCSDNGVVDEGVASAPQSVTMAQTVNFTMKKTGVGALARQFGTDMMIIDTGINGKIPGELSASEYTRQPAGARGRIIDRKIAMGTDNIACGPAMTREQALKAVGIGIEAAGTAAAQGYDIIGAGEMGIGNTTTGSAVLSALTGLPAGITAGRGGGINDRSYLRKKEIVDNAVSGRKFEDVPDILACVGGFDIAAMAGLFIGAAEQRIPAVIDGYISAVAALAAFEMEPGCRDYMFASHRSAEAAYDHVMDSLGLTPLLDLGMRLGEGSGCVLAFEIIKGACGVMEYMATFDEARIDDSYLEEIRKGGCF